MKIGACEGTLSGKIFDSELCAFGWHVTFLQFFIHGIPCLIFYSKKNKHGSFCYKISGCFYATKKILTERFCLSLIILTAKTTKCNVPGIHISTQPAA